MHAWEIPFEKDIKQVRSSEISDITKVSYYRAVFTSCSLILDRTTLFLTITCFVLLGHKLTSDLAFSMAQFLNILQLILAIHVPIALSVGAECLTSIKRLKDFLMMEEKEMTNVESTCDGCVQIDQVFANWIPTTPTLENITLKIPSGCLCAVVGSVGSGKSSLLQVRRICYFFNYWSTKQ